MNKTVQVKGYFQKALLSSPIPVSLVWVCLLNVGYRNVLVR